MPSKDYKIVAYVKLVLTTKADSEKDAKNQLDLMLHETDYLWENIPKESMLLENCVLKSETDIRDWEVTSK